MKLVGRLVALAALSISCGASMADAPGGEEPQSPEDTVAETEAAAGNFALVPPSPEHRMALATPPDATLQVDAHQISLGYVPTPVALPQPEKGPTLFSLVGDFGPKFDLRTTDKLTAIRDQGACGACWAFASYASSESALLGAQTWDFSEEHLNNAHGFDVPACQGGNSAMAIAYLSRGAGPASETDAPYTGKVRAFAKAPAPRKHLREAWNLGDRSGALDNDTIKNAVANDGAVYTTMNWQSANYRAATAAYYHPGPRSSANHAVAIVGWDDDFPAASFAKVAPGNGAFLVRNSWGSGFGVGGYFYVSYHDPFIGRENVVFRAFGEPTDFAGALQYDRFGATGALTYAGGVTYSGNIFTAAADSNLQAVSFYTTAPNATASISVYETPSTSPSSGNLVGTVRATQAFAGYHTVSVGSLNAKLRAGKTIGVVVSIATSQSKSFLPLEVPFAGYSSTVVATAGRGFVSGDGATWVDTAKSWKANVPIKAFYGASPDCDDKNACTVDAWNGTSCTHVPVAVGVVCRAATGACDSAEVCNGSGAPCPADVLSAPGTVCRAAAGDCDNAEVCTGKSAACPANTFKSKTTVCRPAAGACDVAELCTGNSAACPTDRKKAKGTVCRAATGPCDAPESCDGASSACPDDKPAAAGIVCRAKAGVCDVAEACDGVSTVCPPNAFVAAGTVCRTAAGVCDAAESCTGTSALCPADTFLSSSVVCRAASGDCDAVEVCSGRARTCGADALRPRGFVCSESPVKKTCTGSRKTCE
jgi:C1A family cysteine protease